MYKVIVLMREKGEHATFLPAFRQFTDEVLALHRNGSLNSVSIGTCWIECNDVPAHFQPLTDFGIDNGLIKDGEPVADFPDIDEAVIARFYSEVKSKMMGWALDRAVDALNAASDLAHDVHTQLKGRTA